MAVTILERPEGYTLDSDTVDGVSFNFDDVFHIDTTPNAHGLSIGDIIYVVSDIEAYNGFKKIGSVGSAVILGIQTLDGEWVDFFQVVDITYYNSELTHGWSAVHLPITYRLSNDLYPTNSQDTLRNISSVTDYNGFSVLHLSGSLGSGINSYDFVKITVPNDTELSGVYQIVEFVSPTTLIINLTYDSSNNFTSATALKHYNNYNIVVRVYAGINATHDWASQKPYELAATLELTPDENNEVFFSINEILKSYVETRNNLTLNTLPNNIDFWTNFYISVSESYDDSDGYVFGTHTGNFTSDQSTFEGSAVNAKLEFKNTYSGSMSEYLASGSGSSSTKFLTLFDRPVVFEGQYFDLSFLSDKDDLIYFTKQYYLNGDLVLTENETISTQGIGVFRVQIEADCDYDYVNVTLYQEFSIEPETASISYIGIRPTIYIGPPT